MYIYVGFYTLRCLHEAIKEVVGVKGAKYEHRLNEYLKSLKIHHTFISSGITFIK